MPSARPLPLPRVHPPPPNASANPQNFIAYALPRLTVARLRQFSERIQVHTHINLALKSQERKSDIIEKCVHPNLVD